MSFAARRRSPNSLPWALFVTGVLVASPAPAATDPRTFAVEAAQKIVTDCAKCSFFAVPAKSPLIKNHSLFYVSTLDRIPSPALSVAVGGKGKTYVLGTPGFDDWNALFKQEGVDLSRDVSVHVFIEAFLDLAHGRAVYIRALPATEQGRVRKKAGKVPLTTTKVVRAKDRIGLFFYAKDVTGTLQLWNLTVTTGGQILKSDLREF